MFQMERLQASFNSQEFLKDARLLRETHLQNYVGSCSRSVLHNCMNIPRVNLIAELTRDVLIAARDRFMSKPC